MAVVTVRFFPTAQISVSLHHHILFDRGRCGHSGTYHRTLAPRHGIFPSKPRAVPNSYTGYTSSFSDHIAPVNSPRRASAQDIENSVQYSPIIHPRLALAKAHRQLFRQVWLSINCDAFHETSHFNSGLSITFRWVRFAMLRKMSLLSCSCF